MIEYYGYVIHTVPKDGRGKVTTIEVRKDGDTLYTVYHSQNPSTRDRAIKQAEGFIESQINPIKVGRVDNVMGYPYDLYVSIINGQKFYNAVLTGSWTPGPGGYPDYTHILKIKGLPANSFSKLNW